LPSINLALLEPLRLGTWKRERPLGGRASTTTARQWDQARARDGGKFAVAGAPVGNSRTTEWCPPASIALTIDLAPVNHLKGDLEGAI
jgi:hypothetical protein